MLNYRGAVHGNPLFTLIELAEGVREATGSAGDTSDEGGGGVGGREGGRHDGRPVNHESRISRVISLLINSIFNQAVDVTFCPIFSKKNEILDWCLIYQGSLVVT